ncbi:MAG: hypothetical protein JKY49_15700 [Cohaesibacteraceae bacterium]|nr:hypothetical protein [Cohaesibacteraceae bacterium]MBL4876058.1 hypothetical protein [Cohaesibacteraceae bacterium]
MAKPENTNKRKSDQILRRVDAESEQIGTSSFARVANKAKDHFSAVDIDEKDSIEVWGTRLGRGLALIVMFFLIYYLANQLGLLNR